MRNPLATAAVAILAAALLAPAARADDAPQPAAPVAPPAPWAAKPADQWPPIVLEIDGQLKDRPPVKNAHGFLLRLPTGVVVSLTAFRSSHLKHYEDLAPAWQHWALFAPGHPADRLACDKLANGDPGAAAYGFIAALPADQSAHLPATALDARTTPVAEGESLSVVGYSATAPDHQLVAKATVTQAGGFAGNFVVTFDDPAQTGRGLIGSPVVDAAGRCAGLFQGRTDATHYHANQTCDLAPAIAVPPGVTPAAAK